MLMVSLSITLAFIHKDIKALHKRFVCMAQLASPLISLGTLGPAITVSGSLYQEMTWGFPATPFASFLSTNNKCIDSMRDST